MIRNMAGVSCLSDWAAMLSGSSLLHRCITADAAKFQQSRQRILRNGTKTLSNSIASRQLWAPQHTAQASFAAAAAVAHAHEASQRATPQQVCCATLHGRCKYLRSLCGPDRVALHCVTMLHASMVRISIATRSAFQV